MDILTRLDACAECEQAPLAPLLSDAATEIRRLHSELAALRAKYSELLLGVVCKFPNESRHETALRYIHEREMPKNNPPQAALLPASVQESN